MQQKLSTMLEQLIGTNEISTTSSDQRLAAIKSALGLTFAAQNDLLEK